MSRSCSKNQCSLEMELTIKLPDGQDVAASDNKVCNQDEDETNTFNKYKLVLSLIDLGLFF